MIEDAEYASIDEVGHDIDSEAGDSEAGPPPLLESEGSEVGQPAVDDGDSSEADLEELPTLEQMLAEVKWHALVAEEAEAEEHDHPYEELEEEDELTDVDLAAERASQQLMLAATGGRASYLGFG